jgi:hypothetical protein
VPELAIALVAVELEPAIAPAVAEIVRPTVPAAEAIVLQEAEGVVLAVAVPVNASVAAMFLGAAVPAGVVPLAVVVG